MVAKHRETIGDGSYKLRRLRPLLRRIGRPTLIHLRFGENTEKRDARPIAHQEYSLAVGAGVGQIRSACAQRKVRRRALPARLHSPAGLPGSTKALAR